MTPAAFGLSHLLSGRDARAYIQKFMLRTRGVSCVLQISLNIPGFPKDAPEGTRAILLAARLFIQRSGELPASCTLLSNGAGPAEIMALMCTAAAAKRTAAGIEDGFEWGRAIDADVMTADGPVSLDGTGRPPRKCFLCGAPAKDCARLRVHSVEALRAEAFRLLALARP